MAEDTKPTKEEYQQSLDMISREIADANGRATANDIALKAARRELSERFKDHVGGDGAKRREAIRREELRRQQENDAARIKAGLPAHPSRRVNKSAIDQFAAATAGGSNRSGHNFRRGSFTANNQNRRLPSER